MLSLIWQPGKLESLGEFSLIGKQCDDTQKGVVSYWKMSKTRAKEMNQMKNKQELQMGLSRNKKRRPVFIVIKQLAFSPAFLRVSHLEIPL
jgi:hypothetical protein